MKVIINNRAATMRERLNIFLSLSILLCSMLISTAYATKMGVPLAEKIYSGNKKYYVDFNPASKKQKVMLNKHILWTFTYPVQFDDHLFISNNGKYVYIVRSRYVQEENLLKPALLIYSRPGLSAQYSYKKLSVPRRFEANEPGPIGSFWRVWRKEVRATQQGSFLVIPTEGKVMNPILMNVMPTRL